MLSIIQAAGWPIWPLLVCSVLAVALVIERFWRLRTLRVLGRDVLADISAQIQHGRPSAEVLSAWQAQSDMGAVLVSSLYALERHPTCSEVDLRNTVETAGRLAAQRMEQYLSALATIASAAPLLGLLGTVVGMIEIFAAQSQSGGGNPVQMAQGISIALYNTAFGLVVAVPALIAWRYFRSQVDGLILAIETDAESLVRHLLAQREQGGDRP